MYIRYNKILCFITRWCYLTMNLWPMILSSTTDSYTASNNLQHNNWFARSLISSESSGKFSLMSLYEAEHADSTCMKAFSWSVSSYVLPPVPFMLYFLSQQEVHFPAMVMSLYSHPDWTSPSKASLHRTGLPTVQCRSSTHRWPKWTCDKQ